MLVKLTPGSISPTYFRAAFTPVPPKSVTNQSSHQYLFTLLGSMGAKATHVTLMKLTTGLPVYKLNCLSPLQSGKNKKGNRG